MLAAPTASELSPTFGWEGGFPVEDECYLSPQYRCPATGTKDMNDALSNGWDVWLLRRVIF